MNQELATKKKIQVLRFILQNINLSMDTKYIDQVIALPWIERIPASAEYLLGFINMTGKASQLLIWQCVWEYNG